MIGGLIMIDTHCHILSEYYDNIDEEIEKIKEAGVKAIIVNGTNMKNCQEVLRLVSKYDIVYGAIGFHPTELEDVNLDSLDFIEKNISNDKIVAIGEIGLDYHYDNTDKEEQQLFFRRQLEIASKYHKPVIIHSRDAIGDTYNILKEYSVSGTLHCYSGSLEMAREFTKLGICLGIGGVCTYNNAKNIIEVIKNINLEYILLETDAPYLTPVPYRKYTNSPKYLGVIANKIADVKGISYDEVIRTTTANAGRIFDIYR